MQEPSVFFKRIFFHGRNHAWNFFLANVNYFRDSGTSSTGLATWPGVQISYLRVRDMREKKFQTCCGIIPEIPHYTLKLYHKTRSLKKFRKLENFLRWEKNETCWLMKPILRESLQCSISSSITMFSRYYCSKKERCKAGLMISENRLQYPHVSIFSHRRKISNFRNFLSDLVWWASFDL